MSNEADASGGRARLTEAPEPRRAPRPAGVRERRRRRLTERIAHQWAELRAERRAAEPSRSRPDPRTSAAPRCRTASTSPPPGPGASSSSPRGLRDPLAARLLPRASLPLVVALLIAALVEPAGRRAAAARHAARARPRSWSCSVGLAFVATLLTFAGSRSPAAPTTSPTRSSRASARSRTGSRPARSTPATRRSTTTSSRPRTRSRAAPRTASSSQVTEVGTALGHVLAGLFIVLFSTYFFLADGDRIWAWLVRLAPRAARARVDSSGRVAWISLTQFVRATVLVAATDAVGIMIAAAILACRSCSRSACWSSSARSSRWSAPSSPARSRCWWRSSTRAPSSRCSCSAAVVLVQQIESHVLQPFLMGRFVSVHPLGVIVAIGCGVLVAGIAGRAGRRTVRRRRQRRRAAPGERHRVGEDPAKRLEEELEPRTSTPRTSPSRTRRRRRTDPQRPDGDDVEGP